MDTKLKFTYSLSFKKSGLPVSILEMKKSLATLETLNGEIHLIVVESENEFKDQTQFNCCVYYQNDKWLMKLLPRLKGAEIFRTNPSNTIPKTVPKTATTSAKYRVDILKKTEEYPFAAIEDFSGSLADLRKEIVSQVLPNQPFFFYDRTSKKVDTAEEDSLDCLSVCVSDGTDQTITIGSVIIVHVLEINRSLPNSEGTQRCEIEIDFDESYNVTGLISAVISKLGVNEITLFDIKKVQVAVAQYNSRKLTQSIYQRNGTYYCLIQK